MAKVTVSIVTAPQSFPFGTVAGSLKVSLGDVFLEQEDGPFVFDDVAVGTYTITAERVDASGATLGTKVSKVFTVSPTSTEILVPVDFTAVQG